MYWIVNVKEGQHSDAFICVLWPTEAEGSTFFHVFQLMLGEYMATYHPGVTSTFPGYLLCAHVEFICHNED